MNRRWIRIDRAHRAFDCSELEFDVLLNEAESKSASAEMDSKEISIQDASNPSSIFGELELVEAINAELAQLAALQRRDRFIQRERAQSGRETEEATQGRLLADLHANSLRNV